jgi:hypothetical protein
MQRVIDQPGKADTYPDETWVGAKIDAWLRLMAGGGVRGDHSAICWYELQAMSREQHAESGSRSALVVSDAELTGRAVAMMDEQDPKGWRALYTYHRRASNARIIAKQVKCHHKDVPGILKRAHENFRHYRALCAETGPIAYAGACKKL